MQARRFLDGAISHGSAGSRLIGAPVRWTRARLQKFARDRQGIDSAVTRLRARRVYILPTGVGIVFALMAFVMLLGSMNYNNNLSFVLTFMLVGIGLVAMHACQRNLVDLEVSFAGTEPVFAGQPAKFRIAIANHGKHARHRIRVTGDATIGELQDIGPGQSRVFTVPVPTETRGWVVLPRFGVRTQFPFDLFGSWAWLHMDLQGLVYPRPSDNPPSPPASENTLGHRQHDARGEEDFAGLRKFVDGDAPRQVAWKAYARGGELLTKQFSGSDTSSQWFDFDAIADGDIEARLSILTRWIVDADRTGEDYGLKLPGHAFAPANGEAHRRHCLETLALFGEPAED